MGMTKSSLKLAGIDPSRKTVIEATPNTLFLQKLKN